MNGMNEICAYAPRRKMNLQDLFAKKIGYSRGVFYFGKTKQDQSLYAVSKTSAVVGGDKLILIGELEDIEKAHKNLEKKLKLKLIKFSDKA